jgi:hypothetical protein
MISVKVNVTHRQSIILTEVAIENLFQIKHIIPIVLHDISRIIGNKCKKKANFIMLIFCVLKQPFKY